jgi:hypothetical protein
VWSAKLAGNDAVFFASSANHGATFSMPSILSIPPWPNSSGATIPVIGVGPSGKIGVAWQDHGPASLPGSNFDIFFRRSTDEGGTFSNPVNLSNTPNQGEDSPQIAVDSHGNAYLVWEGSNASNVFFSQVPVSSSLGDFRIIVSPKSMKCAAGRGAPF